MFVDCLAAVGNQTFDFLAFGDAWTLDSMTFALGLKFVDSKVAGKWTSSDGMPTVLQRSIACMMVLELALETAIFVGSTWISSNIGAKMTH